MAPIVCLHMPTSTDQSFHRQPTQTQPTNHSIHGKRTKQNKTVLWWDAKVPARQAVRRGAGRAAGQTRRVQRCVGQPTILARFGSNPHISIANLLRNPSPQSPRELFPSWWRLCQTVRPLLVCLSVTFHAINQMPAGCTAFQHGDRDAGVFSNTIPLSRCSAVGNRAVLVSRSANAPRRATEQRLSHARPMLHTWQPSIEPHSPVRHGGMRHAGVRRCVVCVLRAVCGAPWCRRSAVLPVQARARCHRITLKGDNGGGGVTKLVWFDNIPAGRWAGIQLDTVHVHFIPSDRAPEPRIRL
jgi:hypothetical protein